MVARFPPSQVAVREHNWTYRLFSVSLDLITMVYQWMNPNWTATDPYNNDGVFWVWTSHQPEEREPTLITTLLREKTAMSTVLLILQRCRISWLSPTRGLDILSLHFIFISYVSCRNRSWNVLKTLSWFHVNYIIFKVCLFIVH